MISRRIFLRNAIAAGAGAAISGFLPSGEMFSFADDYGYKALVTGGFIRERGKNFMRIRALSLNPAIRIKIDSSDIKRLDLEIFNVIGKELGISGEGIGQVENNSRNIKAALDFTAVRETVLTTDCRLPSSGKLDFIAFSDTHFGDPESVGHTGRVIEHVNARSPLFAVDAGDIIDVDEPPQWEIFEEQDALFNMPLFTTIGNHDSYVSTRQYRQRLGDLFSGFIFNGTQFLFLDNAQKYNNATLYMSDGKRNAQWEWLREKLTEPAKQRLVFFHFPVFGSRSMLDEMYLQGTPVDEREKEVSEMMSLFRSSGVKYICCGHLHSPDRKKLDGIVHLRMGGGGGSKASRTDDNDVSFVHFFIDDMGIRDYTTYLYFRDADIKRIEFCEMPDRVGVNAAQKLIVHGVVEKGYCSIKPDIKIVSGPGSIEDGRYFMSGESGAVTLQADYAGYTTRADFNVV